MSQDFLGCPASSIVDVPLLEVADGAGRLIAWYDNEAGTWPDSWICWPISEEGPL